MSLMQLQLSFAWIMTMMMMWTRVTRDIVEAQRKKLGRGTMFDLGNLSHIVNIFGLEMGWRQLCDKAFFSILDKCLPIIWGFFKVFVVPLVLSTLKNYQSWYKCIKINEINVTQFLIENPFLHEHSIHH